MRSEQLQLVVSGAFKSPLFEINLFVTNHSGFNYVVLSDKGKYVSNGMLKPEIIDWLKNQSIPTLKVKPGFTIQRLTPFETRMTTEVHYSSIHHMDER